MHSFGGEIVEFASNVKEPLAESVKFTFGLRLQLRLEKLEEVAGGGDGLANGGVVGVHRSSGGREKELGNGVKRSNILASAMKFTLLRLST